MEIYLVPYTPRHRYWTGLLLLVRVSVYLVSAFNPSGDPRVIVSTTIFILTSLVIYIATFGVRLYENRFINVMETLTYFNIMALTIFTWYTIDTDTNQTIITNISIGITFFQLIAIIVFHAYKYLMNQKFYVMIKGSTIYDKIRDKLTKKEMNNYNIPQIQPKPVQPTQSVVEISLKSIISPPPLEAIKEKTELESEQQQEREQDGISISPVTEENLATEIDKNKECSCPGIEILKRDDSIVITKPGNDIEHSSTILAENSIPKLYSNLQINCYSDIKQAKVEAMEMTQSDDKDQSSQDVPPFPAGSGQQEEGYGSQCITVEAEIHDY